MNLHAGLQDIYTTQQTHQGLGFRCQGFRVNICIFLHRHINTHFVMVCMYSNTLAPDPFFDIVSSLSSSRDWRLLAPRNASSITACITEKIQYFCYGFRGHHFAQLTTTTLKRTQPTTIMYEPRKNAGPLSNCTNSSPFSPYLPSSSKCLSVLH